MVSNSKTESDASANDSEDLYEIGAASRLTGISSHVLRVWERRYGVVEPDRTDTKRRRYTREDIRRLTLLKRLVDRGHAIGSIAQLSIPQLEERLSEEGAAGAAPAGPSARKPCRIAVAGNLVTDAAQQMAASSENLRLVTTLSDEIELAATLRKGSVDLLILERATLFADAIGEIQSLMDSLEIQHTIVVYRFAQGKTLEQFDKDIRGITAMRAPVDATELRMACLADYSPPVSGASPEPSPDLPATPNGDFPPRRFTDSQLARISRMTSVVQCECPQHLANLLSSLFGFESYSAQCENRNEKDARLHAFLHRSTAEARAIMERALDEVLKSEGIEVGK